MAWLSIKNTQAVAKKLKNDLARILWITDLVIQIAFIFYYLYLTITNLGKQIYHETYALFFLLGLAMLIYSLICKFQKVDKHRTRFVKMIVRYVKYPVRVALIALSLYEIIKHGGTETATILVSISIILLIAQVIVQLVIRMINSYIDYFVESLKMDYEDSELIRAVVNSRKNPVDRKSSGLLKIAKNYAVDKVNDFIEENKDSVPLEEPTKYEAKIRKNISDLQK